MMRCLQTCLAMWGLLLISHVTAAAEPEHEHFRTVVAPLLQQRCVSCHNQHEHKGGLSLQTHRAVLDSGYVEPGQPADSYLLEVLVAAANAKPTMPKNGTPLTAKEVAAVRKWIADGAKWPAEFVIAEPAVDSTDWWSLQPIAQVNVPNTPWPHGPASNPIDHFIAAKLTEHNLQPAAEATRQTLIRRVSYDLIGLPPTPEEVQAFVADPDPLAYEKLVDRLLASPRYGERWARHWLDVVHYGETHGYDKDQPRPNAWPYRDYVIRAFNEDKPYARFVQEQIAGDALFGETVDGYEALGFLAAGPWDLIGHAEVPETKTDGKIARHLDRDDMVSNTINTFCSLTIHCAQCHNHKFDPLLQEDYYRLQAVFAALDRTDKKFQPDPTLNRKQQELEQQQKLLAMRQAKLESQLAQQGGAELAALDKQLASAKQASANGPRPEYGYHSGIAPDPQVEKWVQVDLGAEQVVNQIVAVGCHDTFNNIGAGFGFPVRFKVETATDAEFQQNRLLVADHTAADVPNPGVAPQVYNVGGRAARYVRVTATKLALRQNDYIFALAELQVLDMAGKNLAGNANVTALDTIEAKPRWARQNLVDDIFPDSPPPLTKLQTDRQALLDRVTSPELRGELQTVTAELAKVQTELKQLPAPRKVYAATVHTGSGSFQGTGANGGKPRPIYLLARGDVTKPGKLVEPGAIVALRPLEANFQLPPDHSESARRVALAQWLTDRQHPLTWRSIVNRVWLYHFGHGLVDTPNDFGRMGQTPSHPELLDWLARTFRDEHGGSLKQLHRLLVTSATYRQRSDVANEAAARLDADNRLLWRMNGRKLEAEAIRDSLLQAAGKLDLQMGGPSFQDFVIEKPQHSPHYQYHLADPENPALHRRAVYRFLVRSQQQPWMATLDCADPSLLVDKRNQTITPLQALAQLNNQLVVAMAKHLAARVSQAQPDVRAQLTAAFWLTTQRAPREEELTALVAYCEQHGLPNTCRVLVNLNEFVFVD